MATRETPGGAGEPGRWSRAPEDLSGDAALRAASRVEFEGRSCPSVGKIALLARLGRGGMGVVYYGVHPRLGTEVAVKLLPADAIDRDKEAVDRFVREARLAARLRSDHLVAVIDVDRDEPTGAHYIVMEYVRGVTAGKLLREAEARGQKGLPESVALDLCIAATRGLVAAHVEGVLHRDIKPDNLLVPFGPGGEPIHARAKLADLGLARKETGDEGITVSHIAMGTPGYMAPEQARDARSARKPADVFSIGATLYALLSGEPPFRGATAMDTILRTMNGDFHSIRVLRKDVSDATAEFLERSLAKDPHERFPDAPAVLEALEICRSALRETAAPADTRGRIQVLVRRKEQGKRVVSDPLATPTPPPVPEDASAVAAPVAAAPRPHHAPGAPRRGAAERTRKGSPALLAAAGVLVLAVVAAFLVLRGGSGPPAGLHVDSTPQGARVILDGGVVGTTPHFVAGLSGRHSVRLELDGHEPFQSADVVVAAGERRELRPVLARAAVEEGLEISTEPDGASVAVDGRPVGKVVGGVALHVPGLAYGTHTVKVTLGSYEPWSRDVVVRKGEKSAVRAVLVRATNGLVITGGAPAAKVRLERVGPPPKQYEWTFDDDGRVAVPSVEAGEYRAECEHPSFQPWSARVVVPDQGAPPTVVAGMREHEGTLRVHSRPPGADVIVDGRAIGKTPVQGAGLPAGERGVELRLAEHAPVKAKVRIRGHAVHDMGIVELPPFGSLDLSQLPSDVVVKLGKETVANGHRLAPGERKLVLERPDHATHEVTVAVEAGKPAVVLPAKPWEQFQARLDLSGVEPGTRVFLDGKLIEASPGWASDREVAVTLRRPGFEPVALKVAVKVGSASPLPAPAWTRISTRLDLADCAFGVTVDGKSAADGQALAPGPHTIAIGRDKAVVVVDWQRAVRPPIWNSGGGTTRLALDWLAKHQSPDGRWDCDGFNAQCKSNKCSGPGEAVHDPGVTGLALSAFLGAGETTSQGPHKDTVAAALRYLRSIQDTEGCFGPRTSEKFQYNHAIASAAMSDAWRLTGDTDIRDAAQRGVNFVHLSRNPYLAWRYGVRDGDNDTSVTFWMCRALRAGTRAELSVDRGAWVGVLAWLDKMTEPEFGKAGYQQRGGLPYRTPAMAQKFPADQSESLTAASCLIRLWAGHEPKSDGWEFVVKGTDLLTKRLPKWDVEDGCIDFCYWHFGTQVALRVGGDIWKKWREPLFKALVEHQRLEVDRDERGSWDPEDPWAPEGGRVYSTAINCLTIQMLGK